MIPPIVCFVGRSSVGKTTFLEKLLPELAGRGHRVGVVKHDVHGFELDQPGKDTWRLRQAGAQRVALSSPRQFALLGRVDHEIDLDTLAERYLGDVDIVLVEGYKRSKKPKIEVCRAARSGALLCTVEELAAVISDLRLDLPCPQFDLDDAAGVADLLEARFLGRPAPTRAPLQVSLRVDGREVALKPFVQEMLAGAVQGLLRALKNTEGERIELRIEGSSAKGEE